MKDTRVEEIEKVLQGHDVVREKLSEVVHHVVTRRCSLSEFPIAIARFEEILFLHGHPMRSREDRMKDRVLSCGSLPFDRFIVGFLQIGETFRRFDTVQQIQGVRGEEIGNVLPQWIDDFQSIHFFLEEES